MGGCRSLRRLGAPARCLRRSHSPSVESVPDASDPSFAREERRARARRAAADASPERQQELRSRHISQPAPPRQSRTAAARRPATDRSGRSVDVAAVAASARAALDAHPSTWTSYAELCSANGLDRGLSRAIARQLIPEPTGDHWFRIRSSDGVYNVPTDETERGGPVRYSQVQADRALEAIGVQVLRHHADPDRKLLWMHGEWCLAGR